ncbi:MAG: molybdopterin-dependent oxidoreductase, partial [Gemmatimonadetes bacterium]|nr:molybdopterin-dependent oxidoreductase [Gemmatimonadota bacterium]
MDRRRFIQALGAGTGIVAFSQAHKDEAKAFAEGETAINPSDLTWGKAPCRYCGTGCGVEAGVKDGKVMAVRGDTASPVNKGLLCVKGYHLPAMLYGKDRLTHPMKRAADGKSWEKISWDDALDLIASKYREALDESGPESVSIYGSGQWTIHDGYAALKWFKGGMRSNNIEPNARLCMASAVMGFVTQFQSDEPMGCYEDFEEGDDFIMWGNNMAEMHPVLFSRILESKRKKPNVRIVDIATRRTPTTDYADMYVEFRPGSDLALANGILHLLIESGKLDDSFIKENIVFKRGIEDLEKIGYGCYGDQAEHYTFSDETRDSSIDEFKKLVAEYTPAHVSKISGVPEGQIRSLAEMYGDQSRGTISLWCMG